MSATEYERRIAERFAQFLAARDNLPCSVTPADNPPDFLLTIGESQTWLELSDVFLSNSEAKFLNRPQEKPFEFHCAVDELARRLRERLDNKLGKQSYERVARRLGAGTLLLTCQHCVLTEVDIAHVEEAVRTYKATTDRGFFRVAYFEYQLQGESRQYVTAYRR